PEAALNGTVLQRLVNPLRLVATAVLALAFVPALRLGARVGRLTALGISFLVGSGFTVGWLYEVYCAFGTLLAAMVVLELASGLADRFAFRAAPLATGAGAASLSAGAFAISTHPFLMMSVHSA